MLKMQSKNAVSNIFLITNYNCKFIIACCFAKQTNKQFHNQTLVEFFKSLFC